MLPPQMNREAAIAIAAYRCLYPGAVELEGATVLRTEAAPASPMVNQILGLGLERPATEEQVDGALAAMGEDVTCYVAVSAGARPPELPDWLAARGLEPGWGWMWFRRGVEPLHARTSLRLVPVGDGEAAEFGRVVATGYGLPPEAAAFVSRAHEVGWDCWLALDGDEPAGAAGLFVQRGVGYLGFAATLPEHRGKGGQAALLARRIEHARELGCELVVTETGERRDDLPSSSYRNILRAGFQEAGVRANWLRPMRSP
jgi:GNAT superfamily N-acetyltransferase